MNPEIKSTAISLASQNNLDAALDALEQQHQEGKDWDWLFLKGWLMYQKQDNTKATSFFRESLHLNPNNPDAVLFLGLALGAQATKHKGWALIRDHAKRALSIVCSNPQLVHWPTMKQCLELLADAATNVGPASDAELAYRALIDIHPDNAAYHEKLAEVVGERDLQAAAAALEQAAKLNPRAPTLTQDLNFLRSALIEGNRGGQVCRARYPTTEEMRGDTKSVIANLILNDVPKAKFITKHTSFFTMGSCFAREIATKLQERGRATLYLEMAEHINNTFANRCAVKWAMGQCSGQPKERLDSMFETIGVTPDRLMKIWRNADVFIYTLGVAPAFFDAASGEFVMPKGSALNSHALAELFEFRTPSVSENLSNLNFIFEQIRSINPDCHFVITISPVPLRMTFEFNSALNADCLSKSTLRVVAHEFMQQRHRKTYYWPSFEAVRWLGAHVGPYYGADDDSSLHISEELIGIITDLFIDHFSSATEN